MRNQLGEREMHATLHDIFKGVKNLPELHDGDGYFAEIVKRGYFREIISTNIDDLVEKALHHAGLIEEKDFEVVIAGKRPSPQQSQRYKASQAANGPSTEGNQYPPQQRELPYRLTKVFGDWLSREYTIYNRHSYILNNDKLNQYLHTLLHGDVLAVGIDHLWDSAMLPLLLASPATLWLVSEDEKSIDDQQIASILHQKKEKAVSIVGENYGHEDFWRILYHHLNRKHTQGVEYQRPMPFDKQEQKQEKKKAIRVFYVYCDEDLPVMEKLWRQLKVLRADNLIEEWHRGMLRPGEHRQLTQERYLSGSQLIFVGFSSSFLDSEYHEQALQALKLSSGGAVTLVPLLLRPIGNWKHTPFGEITPLPSGGKTLSRMSSTELEEELSKIAEAIRGLVINLLEIQN
ncbi:hypothetical protein KSF_036220 [Reticulibacter mediterranei]|uniref:TIR domain-containing protein n=2 Tax=Reticulibacter mediterranei TaxID=2778369 RepID=A0A8J3IL91_9CHLR|nr:hypothetical protein KSF_036220 [Reticulibacter mediterranei]